MVIYATVATLNTDWGKQGYLPVILINEFVVNYVFCLIGLLVDKLLKRSNLSIKIPAFMLLGYLSGVLVVLLFDRELNWMSLTALITVVGAVMYCVGSTLVKPLWLKYSISLSSPFILLVSLLYLFVAYA